MNSKKGKSINSIEDAARLFGEHEGISIDSIKAWTVQFGPEHQELAFKILRNIKYYSKTAIRTMVGILLEKLQRNLELPDRSKILFVPIGKPYESSSFITRVLRDTRGVRPNQIKYQSELANVPKRPSISAIVLMDVFSGTGQQITDWWRNMETLLLPWADKSVKLVLGILVLNHKAWEALKNVSAEKIYVSYLDIKYNILSKNSKIFLLQEKLSIKEYCHKTGCPKEYLCGKGACGLLVAFVYGCPNNSLPILWHESRRWKKLFRRRAI